jgi:hypothetical protein
MGAHIVLVESLVETFLKMLWVHLGTVRQELTNIEPNYRLNFAPNEKRNGLFEMEVKFDIACHITSWIEPFFQFQAGDERLENSVFIAVSTSKTAMAGFEHLPLPRMPS